MLSTGHTGSPHEIFSNFIMFGTFVDGWHSVSDDPVFSYNEKYRTDWRFAGD
jgi:hypothetical protein